MNLYVVDATWVLQENLIIVLVLTPVLVRLTERRYFALRSCVRTN